MNEALLLTLVVLALVDSTSIGTLFVPIWLVLQPGRAVGRILVYLASIAVFYFAVGVALLFGAGALFEPLARFVESEVALYLQLAVGVGLLVLSFRFGSDRTGKDSATRYDRWRGRVTGRSSSTRDVVGLALVAGTLELATMVPYLGAIGLLATSDVAWGQRGLLLAGYVVVMILPALALVVLRVLAFDRVKPWLVRANDWMARNASDTTGWVLAIAGVFLAGDAVAQL